VDKQARREAARIAAENNLREGKHFLLYEEPSQLGIPIMEALQEQISTAKELSAKMHLDVTFVTNALLNLANGGLVEGLEGYPYRVTLRGKRFLTLDVKEGDF
jgi:hypothetical protein